MIISPKRCNNSVLLDSEKKNVNFKHFILDPVRHHPDDQRAIASKMALRTYADVIEAEDPELSQDLRSWVDHILEEEDAMESAGV